MSVRVLRHLLQVANYKIIQAGQIATLSDVKRQWERVKTMTKAKPIGPPCLCGGCCVISSLSTHHLVDPAFEPRQLGVLELHAYSDAP